MQGTISHIKILFYRLNSLLEKRVSFCSSLKALSTDTSFIKIGFCCQKLSTPEFNYHYRISSHCEKKKKKKLTCVHGVLQQSTFSSVYGSWYINAGQDTTSKYYLRPLQLTLYSLVSVQRLRRFCAGECEDYLLITFQWYHFLINNVCHVFCIAIQLSAFYAFLFGWSTCFCPQGSSVSSVNSSKNVLWMLLMADSWASNVINYICSTDKNAILVCLKS